MAKRKTQAVSAAAGTEITKETTAKAAEVETAIDKTEPAKGRGRGRKPGSKKTDVKTRIAVQYLGKEISDQEMVAKAKKAWTAKRNKVGDIKTIDLYVKPEDNTVYFVINGDFTGSAPI